MSSTLPPVTPHGNLRSPLIIGDRYEVSNNRAFIWDLTLWDGFNPSGQTATFSGSCTGCCNCPDAWSKTVPVVDNGDGTYRVTFELSAAETETIEAGHYDWSVVIDNEDTTVVSSATHGTVEWVCL